MTTRATVMGTGSWGTAFAKVLADAKTEVTMWGRRQEVVRQITDDRRNEQYLPGIVLPRIYGQHDPAAALRDADIVVLAVPAQALRQNLTAWKELIPADAVLVSLMKGIEVSSRKRMSEVIRETLDWPEPQVCVLSGPNLAREIAEEQPTATVVSCSDLDVAQRVSVACDAGYFRPYRHDDVIGVEVGGAVKNVMALAAGIAEGLGYGDNTKSSLITRGLAETSRLAVAMGGRAETLAGLAGMGDLVATCMSPLSRNHQVGVRLGKGETLTQIMDNQQQVAEGVKSTPAIYELARTHGIESPLIDSVAGVLQGKLAVDQMARGLLSRSLKAELDRM